MATMTGPTALAGLDSSTKRGMIGDTFMVKSAPFAAGRGMDNASLIDPGSTAMSGLLSDAPLNGPDEASSPTQNASTSPKSSIPPFIRPSKLHGREFYESLGRPKIVLAPMVDQSEYVSSSVPGKTDLFDTNPRLGMANAYTLVSSSRQKTVLADLHAHVARPAICRDGQIPR